MNATYSINASDVAQFNKLLANANKKATKVGAAAIVATFGKPYTTDFRDERGFMRSTTMVDVTIDGSTPKYNGWKLVGIVSPLKTDSGEILPIITTVPGETVKTNGLARDPLACDHCKLRRDRLESFIVQHDDGTEKQVGRSCLADFLGDEKMSPAGIAGLMNTLASISTAVAEWHKGPRRFDSESLNLVMACTISVIRNHGWISSKEAYASDGGKTATKTRVAEVMHAVLERPLTTHDTVEYGDWFNVYRGLVNDMPTDTDFETVADYRERLKVILDTKEMEGMNDYFSAIRILDCANTVNYKAMGIAVSIVPTVDRETKTSSDPVRSMLMAAQKTSKFIGAPKTRLDFKDLTFIENYDAPTCSIATFVTTDGNIVKMFSHQLLARGAKVNLKATVVRHSEFKGVNETIVNRPVVLD